MQLYRSIDCRADWLSLLSSVTLVVLLFPALYWNVVDLRLGSSREIITIVLMPDSPDRPQIGRWRSI